MQVTETSTEGLKREYKVVISAKDIEEKVDHRLRELSGQVKLPGFRPGKVPTQLLKKRYGASVMGEVLEQAVNDSSSQAMNERGLRPAMQPKIEILSFDEGKDLEYKLAVELMPDVEPMDFSQLELERIKIDVPDAEVERALERIAESRKQSEPVTEARPAQKGDVLVIDFKGTVNGEAFPGMEAEDHHLELGSSSFIEGFEDQLIGAKVGEQREVKVAFPEEYVNDQLAGQEAVFQVTIKEIRTPIAPTIDDAFAQSLGEENLDSLKEKVREQLGREYDQIARMRLKRQLLDKLAEAHDFEVPAGLVDVEFDTIWKQVDEDRQKGQADPDDAGKDEEQLKAEYRAIAERRVRLGLLLSEVGRLNNIDVTQDELNRALIQEAQKYPGREREVLGYYQKNPELVANLRAPIFEEKVVDFIADLAKVSERHLSPEEFEKEAEQEAAAAEAKAKDEASKTKAASGGDRKEPAAAADAASGSAADESKD